MTITDLAEHTFFATLDLKPAIGAIIHVDCRPSDAIALGVAHSSAIYVEEHVLDAAMKEDP